MSVYVIIGGSSGIGLQLTQQLTEAGHRVYATYHKNKIEDQDLASCHSLNVLDESLSLAFLPETIDGLVYCPGSINLKPFQRLQSQDFIHDFQLNTVGAIKVIQSVLPQLKKSEAGSVVLFSSVAAQIGLPFHTQVATSKGAIEGLTKALAAELAPRIRVNCIAPSLTDTPLAANLLATEEKKEAGAQRHPLKKIGNTKDIADMAEFLLSEKAGWITGQIFGVDGGMSTLKV
jgi:NAD(P)-dependent dehydrogenase (short-subunit alcohol dehydrogenase family)